MSGNVFINYRREDSAGSTGRLYDRLAQRIAPNRLFIDVDDIAPGENFAKILDQQVAQCDVLLAVIGTRWLDARDDGGLRRIDNPADFVRIEIASALKRTKINVVPVLVDGAQMPSANDLPDDLKPLAHRNALEVSAKRFHRDAARLAKTIRRLLPWRVSHAKALRWSSLAAMVAVGSTVFYMAVQNGLIPDAFGLENHIRPSAREWATFTYADKTNPAVLRDFRTRHNDGPEVEDARRWLEFVSSRAWSKVRDLADPAPIDDFLYTFRNSKEVGEARKRLKVLRRSHPEEPGEAIKPLERFRDCPQCPEMVVIPAGVFSMGSLTSEQTNPKNRNESPVQRVTIAKQFAIGRFEVTVGQFKAFVADTRHEMGDECINILNLNDWDKRWDDFPNRHFKSPGYEQTDDHPVVCVSWNDVNAYVNWLSRKTGEQYRLPSEAEWEYSARAGSADRYTFGDDEGQMCLYGNGQDRGMDETWDANRWCADGHRIGTAPVGSYRPNAFGLRDMHGNVNEWVADCYHPGYSDMPDDVKKTGVEWTAAGCAERLIRGGCWAYTVTQLRSARREAWKTVKRSFCVGFRVVRALRS